MRFPAGLLNDQDRMIPYEGQLAYEDLDQGSNGHRGRHKYGGKHGKCDHKNCAVGRHSKRNSSWFRQKIHLVDVSKLRQPKLCMKASLVGEDCKPLLIKAGEDVTVPLVTPEQQKKQETAAAATQQRDCNRKHCGKFGLLLDALARTFCLPLLG